MIDRVEDKPLEEGKYEAIIRKHEPLLKEIVSDYYAPSSDFEDLLQEARIALTRAYDSYNPQRGVPFSSYAALCVRRQIQDYVKKQRRKKHQILNESNSLDEKDLRYPSNEPDPESRLLASEALNFLREVARESLSDLERRVLAGYLAGDSYQTLANKLDRDEKSIDNALTRIRRKIGRNLDKGEFSLEVLRLQE